MWEKAGLVKVNPDDLPTVLLPENHSAKEVIFTALRLNSQAFGFHTPYRDLKDIAKDQYCKDPRLIDKAMNVVGALNAASKEKGEEKNDGGEKEPVN